MKFESNKLADNTHAVAESLAFISDPYRLMILCCLADGELTVEGLNKNIELTVSALSQHLAKLIERGLVSTRLFDQTIFYRVDDVKLQALFSTKLSRR